MTNLRLDDLCDPGVVGSRGSSQVWCCPHSTYQWPNLARQEALHSKSILACHWIFVSHVTYLVGIVFWLVRLPLLNYTASTIMNVACGDERVEGREGDCSAPWPSFTNTSITTPREVPALVVSCIHHSTLHNPHHLQSGLFFSGTDWLTPDFISHFSKIFLKYSVLLIYCKPLFQNICVVVYLFWIQRQRRKCLVWCLVFVLLRSHV